ncbi:RNA-binding protein [Roridomyces roridus]|uniref:H/ACA ribonucleoprotein complex subunit 2 n=1 Tax=Roridomyces roridus TaxID=1738132 RepID=A0AAD7C4C8_9AGAR|nr:RNA-binding protein [Roridomyces roridus]
MSKDKAEKKDKKRKEVEPDEDVEMTAADEKSPKKAKKEKEEISIPPEDLSPLAHPLAQKKLLKKLHKTIKKASKARQVKRGVKEVVKGIRKGEKGLLILAADINPIDIISHLPVLSEEAQIPYIFVSSKEELGNASSTKRPTSCVMVCPDQKKKGKAKAEGIAEEKDDDYRELYDEVFREVEALDTQIVF